MLRVGLTGGIGSGKSTVAAIFSLLGVPVYYADDEAKKIMNNNEAVKQEITRVFGTDSYEDGLLNRRFIASHVFNNPEKLAELNAIVHPATIAAAELWLKSQTSPYAIKEAALVFESGSDSGLDKVIGVYAPLQMRIQRVMARDGITENKVTERIATQMDEDKKMELCDFVIRNDEKELLIPQVIAIHETLSSMATRIPAHG